MKKSFLSVAAALLVTYALFANLCNATPAQPTIKHQPIVEEEFDVYVEVAMATTPVPTSVTSKQVVVTTSKKEVTFDDRLPAKPNSRPAKRFKANGKVTHRVQHGTIGGDVRRHDDEYHFYHDMYLECIKRREEGVLKSHLVDLDSPVDALDATATYKLYDLTYLNLTSDPEDFTLTVGPDGTISIEPYAWTDDREVVTPDDGSFEIDASSDDEGIRGYIASRTPLVTESPDFVQFLDNSGHPYHDFDHEGQTSDNNAA